MTTLELGLNIAAESELALEAEPFRFNVALFNRMDELGLFGPEERVELIAGRIIRKTPIGKGHLDSVAKFNQAFAPLWAKAVLWVQSSIVLDSQNEPIPNFALLQKDYFRSNEKPNPECVLLTVEVAQSSRKYDQDVKGPLYARAGIPEFWLVDLGQRKLIVHTEPSPSGYRRTRICAPGDQIAPEAFPDFYIKVAELFP